MGCDIHVHVEVKLNGNWHHYSCIDIGRNYHLFRAMGLMSRGEGEPVVHPRPLETLDGDMTEVTKHDMENIGCVGHNFGWITGVEADRIEKWYESMYGFSHPRRPFGYVFCNGYDSNDYEIRMIYWLDN